MEQHFKEANDTGISFNWYVINTKPRQEHIALVNLQQQGYVCYLPVLSVEKIKRNKLTLVEEALFPRYLFIHLGIGANAQSWSPIRSTKGVNGLIKFGNEPAKIANHLINFFRDNELARQASPTPFFSEGERLLLTNGAFVGVEAIYQMTDGEERVVVLIELLGKQVKLAVKPNELSKQE
ncbi:MAG: transcription/translation regulatory transformer protein RfaH [Methylovulum sp.]|nr:transcription/translation regulatory transformer protein RfaH [Methylovulum sp.]TSA40718.1 MAG: transcription/translation regulatory transformer protein RfaH [Methylococcaceae bacterium]